MTSCKRKRSTNKVVNDSGDASLSFSAAGELYSDCSGISSPRKKRKVNDTSRFQQNDDDFSNRAYTDDVQVFGNHNSSEFHIDSNVTERNECPRTTLASDEQQSSNFEELLFGLLSDIECSQVVSQKSNTKGVKSINERVHKAEICRSVSDTSSDCSDMDISHVADHTNKHRSAEGTPHLDQTGCFLSTSVSSNCDNLSAAGSELHTVVSDRSVSVETDLSQSTGKHRNKKPKKLTEDCATLYSESECHERKPKQAKQHTLACVSPSHMSDNSQYALLRKVHRTVNTREAVCDKMSTQATADTISHCLELNLSGIENISSSDVPKSNKKHKNAGKSKEVTKGSTEFESSQSLQDRKKRHRELVHNVCFSSDSQSVHSVTVRERALAKNDCTQITAATGHLDCSTRNIGVEPDSEDCYWTLQTSCSKKNALEKQVTSTIDCTEFNDSQLSCKKKKKKRHHVHDKKISPYAAELQKLSVDKSSTSCATSVGFPETDYSELNIINTKRLPSGDGCIGSTESERQENSCAEHEKITKFESQSVHDEDRIRSSSSEFTPCKTKSKKKVVSEHTSPLMRSSSSRVAIMHSSVDMQKSVVKNTSTLAAGASFYGSLVSSTLDSKDVLLEKDASRECSTVARENMSVHKTTEEDEFEQLLRNVLVTDKAPVVSQSYHETNLGEDHALSSREHGRQHDLSESTSDDDFDDVLARSVPKQCTSVNTQPIVLQTDSPGHKVGLHTKESKKNGIGPTKCENQMKESQNCSTCSSERSPSLLDSTLLPRFHYDVQAPVQLKEVNDIDRSSPRLNDATVTRDREVSCVMLFVFRTQFVHLLAL